MAPAEPVTKKLMQEIKEKKVDSWIMKPFENPAREDNTQLSHWVK
jgi:hypothetical protein